MTFWDFLIGLLIITMINTISGPIRQSPQAYWHNKPDTVVTYIRHYTDSVNSINYDSLFQAVIKGN
jgi:hypothetical protein